MHESIVGEMENKGLTWREKMWRKKRRAGVETEKTRRQKWMTERKRVRDTLMSHIEL